MDSDSEEGPSTSYMVGSHIPKQSKEADALLTRKQREEKNKHKYVPEHLQEVSVLFARHSHDQVRDEETGKRIMRGAFQGGAIWTVGYHGTVGSKGGMSPPHIAFLYVSLTGFTPSQFTSSREARAKVAQRPEDFMDEEDYKAMGLGQDVVARAQFDSIEGPKGREPQDRCVLGMG